MNWLCWALLAPIFHFTPGAFATTSTAPQWRLVWSDEFNHTGALNPKKWRFETDKDGWGNGELEHYTNSLDNVRVENGHLVIEALREQAADYQYSSGRIHTRGPGWLYGRFEVRAKMPTGAGMWPAIWMLPIKKVYGAAYWPDNGEIDLMEHIALDPTNILGSFYTKNLNWMINTGMSIQYPLPDYSTNYHTFALEWDAERVALSVDGNVFNTYENPHTTWEYWPYDQPFHVILNMAIGDHGGPVDDTALPQQFLVDYVRVYQK